MAPLGDFFDARLTVLVELHMIGSRRHMLLLERIGSGCLVKACKFAGFFCVDAIPIWHKRRTRSIAALVIIVLTGRPVWERLLVNSLAAI